MKSLLLILLVTFFSCAVSLGQLKLAQLSSLGSLNTFNAGDKVILKVNSSNCPPGGVTQELSIVRGGYECLDYKGKRWIRPFDAGLSLFRDITPESNFSLEFEFLTFKEGCPYVNVLLLSEKGVVAAKKGDYRFGGEAFVSLRGSCNSFRAVINSKPTNYEVFEYERKIKGEEIHKVALSVRNGMASVYLDGKKIAAEPFKPVESIKGVGIFFYKIFSTDKAYGDYPALISNLKLSLYTGKKQIQQESLPSPATTALPPPSRSLPKRVASATPSRQTGNVKCINSVGIGEASVIKGDRASAKVEAIAKAKWDAIEKALGVTTSVKTIVQNFKLLDEVIKNEVGGFIKDVKVIKEENFEDMVRVQIKGCVYPKEAEKALSLVSRDTAFSVIVITKRPGIVELDEMNPVTTELINILNQQGFKVYDFAGNPNVNPYDIEKIIAQRRFIALRAYMSRVLSGAIVVGKVELIPSTRTGQDIGYGIRATFNVVTARLNYFLLTHDRGGLRIIASGSLSAMGRAPHIEDANFKAMEALAQKLGSDMLGKIERYMASKRKYVTVVVKGIKSTTQNFAIKEKLQRIPWVQSVEDMGLGKFRVNYLENTVYLANAIERIPELQLIEFSATEVKARLL